MKNKTNYPVITKSEQIKTQGEERDGFDSRTGYQREDSDNVKQTLNDSPDQIEIGDYVHWQKELGECAVFNAFSFGLDKNVEGSGLVHGVSGKILLINGGGLTYSLHTKHVTGLVKPNDPNHPLYIKK